METAQAIMSLISVGVGILATGIPLIITIVKLFKDKTASQNWKTIMSIADTCIKEAEKSGKSGSDKKKMVIDMVKSSCKSQGIDADNFLDQLDAYIDQCIDFVNKVSNK